MSMKKRSKIFIYIVICTFILCMVAFVYSACTTYKIQSQVKEAVEKDISNLSKPKEKQSRNNQELDTSSLNLKEIIINNIFNQEKRESIQESDSSYLDILEKSNGIIGASELTFFFTFIVAVLSIFFMYKNIELDNTVEKFKRINTALENKLKKINTSIENINKNIQMTIEAKQKSDDLLQQSIEKVKNKNIFDNISNRIASVFNLSIMISNVTTLISDQNNDNDMRIAKEAGVLCSRLSLICDQIDIKVLTYLTTDEKDILITYLDDALNGLDHGVENAKSVTNELLRKRIEECIGLVKGIKEIVDDIEERNE